MAERFLGQKRIFTQTCERFTVCSCDDQEIINLLAIELPSHVCIVKSAGCVVQVSCYKCFL